MFELNNQSIADRFGELASSRAEAVMRAWEADVKARWAQRAGEAADSADTDSESEAAGRRYDYDATPGSRRQSFGAWYKVVTSTLADDLGRFRAAPDDLTVTWRLLASITLYGLAGQAFADTLIHTDAVPAEDPLARPELDSKRHKQARVLRAQHLSAPMADAVLDAASSDTARTQRARKSLTAVINEGSVAEVQIAASLLGLIGDPFNIGKLNRLAEEITKARWTPDQAAMNSTGPVNQVTSAAAPARAEIVERGGEHARRLGGDASRRSWRDDQDDEAILYGSEPR